MFSKDKSAEGFDTELRILIRTEYNLWIVNRKKENPKHLMKKIELKSTNIR